MDHLFNRYGNNTETIQHIFYSAQKRVRRNDSPGASETIRNCYKHIAQLNGIELNGLPPIKGTEADVLKHLESGNTKAAVQVLKWIQTELIYGRFRFQNAI